MVTWTGEQAAGGELAWARRGMPCSMDTFRGNLTSRGPRSDLTELGGMVLGGDLQCTTVIEAQPAIRPKHQQSAHSNGAAQH